MGNQSRRSVRCVHCGKWFNGITKDHVFPRAWNPPGSASHENVWTVPSCSECNSRFGALENDLFTKMGLSFGPDDPEFGYIGKKTLRALDSRQGKSPRDKKSRAINRDRILNETIRADQAPPSAVVPNFGPYPGIPLENQSAYLISEEQLREFAGKIVRGIAYTQEAGRYLDDAYRLQIYLPSEPHNELEELLSKFGKGAQNGVALRLRWAHIDDDPNTRLHSIELFKRLKIYAIMAPPDFFSPSDEQD